MTRNASLSRQTGETKITLQLALDGSGKGNISSGNGFFDHMLELFAHHGRFDIDLHCDGDINVDFHHSCEDIGIVLGRTFSQALGDRAGISRYGSTILPMDEALILSATDISGRGMLVYDLQIPAALIGSFDTELVKEFWLAFTREAGITMHIKQLAGENSHHIVEGVFKSVARSFNERNYFMIAVIDYGLGNLFSLISSLKALGAEAVVTSDVQKISQAERLILPGVGAFGDAMARLHSIGLDKLLQEQAASGKPLMGICLGMQILFAEGYEYGHHQGLALIPGQVASLEADLQQSGYALKIPHMGWNALTIHQKDCPLMKNSHDGDFVYFVHSFYAKDCDEYVVASAEYGLAVPAVVNNGNVYGCQFHPEKSGKVGLNILKAFIELEA